MGRVCITGKRCFRFREKVEAPFLDFDFLHLEFLAGILHVTGGGFWHFWFEAVLIWMYARV